MYLPELIIESLKTAQAAIELATKLAGLLTPLAALLTTLLHLFKKKHIQVTLLNFCYPVSPVSFCTV